MSVLFQAPSNVYSAQLRVFESPNPIDPALSRIRITVTRENWPGDNQTPLVTMGIEISQDGVTYPPISGCSAVFVGGVRLLRDNVTPAPDDYVECSVPGVGLTTRKVRLTINNVQQLRTAFKLEGF